MNNGIKLLGCFIALVASTAALAKGVSPYLPLNQSPEIEAHIEKLIALTADAPLSKPYRAADIKRRLPAIENEYPLLASRISAYLERYMKPFGVTHASAEISASSNNNYALANARNQRLNEHYAISGAALGYFNPYVMASVGATYSPDNSTTYQNTFVALGWEFLQIDLGYREHWFSPFQDAAMLVSTHAKASPSITLSNAVPLTKWGFRYEVFYSKLEAVDEIVLGDETFPGSPRHGGVMLSFSPLDNWSIGFNRTLQFGGGERDVTFSDVIEALLDPAGKDNVGDIQTDDINFEFGNQQASITTRVNFNLGMPVSIYAEYAGEDTVNESNFSLGNTATSIGVFLPQLSQNLSLRVEAVDFTSAWYVHHLYPSGYTNDGQIMGHWAGSLREPNSGTPGTVLAVNAVWNFAPNQLIDLTYRQTELEDTRTEFYESGFEAKVRYSYATSFGLFGIDAMLAQDAMGRDANRIALFYRW